MVPEIGDIAGPASNEEIFGDGAERSPDDAPPDEGDGTHRWPRGAPGPEGARR